VTRATFVEKTRSASRAVAASASVLTAIWTARRRTTLAPAIQ
jgi:hypothetical protein